MQSLQWNEKSTSDSVYGRNTPMSSARPSLQDKFECCICKFTGNSIQKIKTHLMVEHLEYFPWLCGKDGCGAVKFSQQKLEEHQLAHHGEECEMKYVPNREKHNELKRCLEAVKHGLKVSQAQLEALMVNQMSATGPHFATSNLSSSTNPNYEQPTSHKSIINIKGSESDDDCVIVHVQSYNPNEPRKSRRSSAASAIQSNHNNASTEHSISGEHVIEESTVSAVGSSNKSLLTIAPILSSSPVCASTPVAQAVVNGSSISAQNQSPSERYYLTSERSSPKSYPSEDQTPNTMNIEAEKLNEKFKTGKGPVYTECRKCKRHIVNFNINKKSHVLTHLLREENLSIFSCAFPGCEMRSNEKRGVIRHVLAQHNSKKESWVKRHDISEFFDKIKALRKLCFGGENKSVTVSPSKITPNVGEKWNPEMRIEPAEPKRRRCQPRNEENISIAPDSRTPTWLFCHVCNKNVCIYIYPTTEYMQVLLSHVGKHMALIYSKARYACSKCDFTRRYSVEVVRHNKSRHSLEAEVDDRILTWTLDEIRDVSFKCFKQRDLIERHMPLVWKTKNELLKDQNTTQMIDPNLPTTSRASMEQQDSEEMESRTVQVDVENDKFDDSEEFYRI